MSRTTHHRSLKTRRSLRARWSLWLWHLSIPAWLARTDERRVIAVVAAVNGGLAILTISLFAWLTDLPLLFPALGPTVFILSSVPFSAAAAPRSVIVGHLAGIMAGSAVWHITSQIAGGAASLQAGPWLICTPAVGLALTSLLLVWWSCPHPPACATAMIIAVGGITSWDGLLLIAAAVVLVTMQTVAVNRLASLPVSLWAPKDTKRLIDG